MNALLSKVQEGVSIAEVAQFQQQYSLTQQQMSFLLNLSHKGYYNLLHRPSGRLGIPNSGKFLKLQQVFQEGEDALMSREAFLEWLNQPHWYFDHHTPFEMLDNPIGADAILEELGRTKYGILS
ncbi:MAG: MbcA/ParS/Xre antitoxin family protein [Tunicatimonas sp.]|uniref:antitoxin Xre/MbcA/ParS toxin-binding domain-containing protein n=1 Tax=Tunicatimonas sp. TaxID=1940096 RepID=UPI003C765459